MLNKSQPEYFIVHQTAKTRRTSANVKNYLKINIFLFCDGINRDTTKYQQQHTDIEIES